MCVTINVIISTMISHNEKNHIMQQSNLIHQMSTITALCFLERFTLSLLLSKLTKQFTHFSLPFVVPTNKTEISISDDLIMIYR